MNGGPFRSAGVARIINGETYRYTFISYAHWVNLTHNHNHVEIRKNRRLVARVPESELEAAFDRIAAGSAAVASRQPAPKSGAAERGVRSAVGISVLPVAAGPGDEDDEETDGLDDTRI